MDGRERSPRRLVFMKFRAVLEYDPVERSYSAVCPELPGYASAGDTEDEAHQNIEEAIRLYLEDAKLIEVTIG